MDPDFTPLDAALGDDADGYLLDADGTDSTQRYLSGFDAPDPFVTCYTPDGVHLLVSGLEYGRASKEARADTVSRLSAYDYREQVKELGRATGRGAVVADFLADHGVDRVAVPGRFPLGTADGLREFGVAVRVDESDAVAEIRAVKTEAELDDQEYVVGRADYADSAMGRAKKLDDGFVKVLAATDRTILGAHAIGYEASTLLHEAVVAMRHGLTVEDVGETIHAHPTLSKVVEAAFRDAAN